MDESQRIYVLKNQENKIIFLENSLQTNNEYSNENSPENFANFSIDNDDVVLLDPLQVILYDVKIVLNHLIDNVLIHENPQSQIRTLPNKRSLNVTNENECLSNKKVRFNIHDDEHQVLNYLFVSETLPSTNQSKPYTQFLHNLGFDLCLEQNLDDNNYLSQIQKQTLINYNQIFHQYQIYSCKYCSFQTDTIHAMDHHYRTPHTLSNSTYHNDKYRCTYCLFQTFRLPELRRHFEKKHGFTLITEQSFRRYRCTYCSYESDDKNNFMKHNNRCQILQTQTRIANNLLAPYDQLNRTINTQQL
jgi:hypothetical protein